jgi:hypothetical protein
LPGKNRFTLKYQKDWKMDEQHSISKETST